ncbi:MAG: hypothetical protein HYS06_05865 [Methylocystis sp.]|nr:hypothetical protein [Methylocystis sp.]
MIHRQDGNVDAPHCEPQEQPKAEPAFLPRNLSRAPFVATAANLGRNIMNWMLFECAEQSRVKFFVTVSCVHHYAVACRQQLATPNSERTKLATLAAMQRQINRAFLCDGVRRSKSQFLQTMQLERGGAAERSANEI